MAAPKGNQYATKPDKDLACFQVQIRGTWAEREVWKKSATGQSWNKWARKVLNKAAALPNPEPSAILPDGHPTR